MLQKLFVNFDCLNNFAGKQNKDKHGYCDSFQRLSEDISKNKYFHLIENRLGLQLFCSIFQLVSNVLTAYTLRFIDNKEIIHKNTLT